MSHLDARVVPGAAAVTDLAVADPDETDDGRHEPAESGQEGEGDDGLELAAGVVAPDGHVTPGEDVTAGPIGAVEILKEANGHISVFSSLFLLSHHYHPFLGRNLR